MKKSRAPCHPTAMSVHNRSPLRYRCTLCHRTYAARHGEISFGSKLNPEEILTMLALLKKGTSVRKTAELAKLSPSTVERWRQRFLQQKLLFNTVNTPYYERV
jgi:transposase-like protein